MKVEAFQGKTVCRLRSWPYWKTEQGSLLQHAYQTFCIQRHLILNEQVLHKHNKAACKGKAVLAEVALCFSTAFQYLLNTVLKNHPMPLQSMIN